MDRVALVTGASRGIGRATAVRLAKDGLFVLINHPSASDGPDETLAAIRQAGGDGAGIQADVGDLDQIADMFDHVTKEYGRLDALVNNAGISTFESLFDITPSAWERMNSVNLRGTFFCSQHAARLMLKGGRGGRIVSIASISAHVGGKLEIAYCATKAGVRSLMESLCLELGPYGITCNSVSPGTVITDTYRAHMAHAAPGTEERYIERVPIGRLGDPAEIASAVAFLVSPEASYINGAEILVDGGVLVNPE